MIHGDEIRPADVFAIVEDRVPLLREGDGEARLRERAAAVDGHTQRDLRPRERVRVRFILRGGLMVLFAVAELRDVDVAV